jgi:uncharacterized protein (DUF2126 family)
MPPVEQLEDYLELLAAVEATAADLKIPIHVEGYGPPSDHRMNVIKVTPDPGVIEVNIHPAERWRGAVAITQGLYEDARQARLGTDKFMLDGRHAGTGGGNHVVLGGATAAAAHSRRPDLQKTSCCTGNAGHPCPTCFPACSSAHQPGARIDEARMDMLHECTDRARPRCPSPLLPSPRRGREGPPWLVDRLFRNLLVDVQGNTIAPKSPSTSCSRRSATGPSVLSGALVLPPDAPGLALQLLLRARRGSGAGARRPHGAGARRCTTASCWSISCGRISSTSPGDLGARRLSLRSEWFDAQRQFRFPVLASHPRRRPQELRQALEPWYVLGEEGRRAAPPFVDSRSRRLKSSCKASTTRHVIT